MRIAIVTETFAPEINGVALTVARLVRGLRERGHVVQIVRPRHPAATVDPESEETVSVSGVALPMYRELRIGLPCKRRLIRCWTRFRPDAVYVATEGPLGYSAISAARRLTIPVATGFHTRFDEFARHYGFGLIAPTVFAYLRRFHRRSNATFAPTAQLRDFLIEHDFGRVELLRRAVDTKMFNPQYRDEALRRTWGLEPGQLGVLHVGRIAPEKNLSLAVRAFREIRRKRPDARFIWVGDGPARTTVHTENPEFMFCGIQRGEELARHYASADLFLFPSLTETFGNVTLEALASGVPAVGFDYAAAREHLHGDSGRCVPFGDADAFVRAACELALAAGLSGPMRLAARHAVDGLDPGSVAANFATMLGALARSRTDARNTPSANRSTS